MPANGRNKFKKCISTSGDQWEGYQPPGYQRKSDTLIICQLIRWYPDTHPFCSWNSFLVIIFVICACLPAGRGTVWA